MDSLLLLHVPKFPLVPGLFTAGTIQGDGQPVSHDVMAELEGPTRVPSPDLFLLL